MNELDKIDYRIDKRITCIIEDYKALKSEISRRSDLQRFALLAYGSVIVLSLKFNDKASFSDFQIILIWLTSSITYLFYLSEDSFIKRLNKIANFNGWFFSHLLEHKDKKLSEFKSLETKFKLYADEVNNIKENIILKDVVFPSELSVIGKIIGTEKCINKKVEFLNILFLLSYLVFLPSIITLCCFDGNYQDILTLSNTLMIIPICFVINLVFSLCLLVASLSKSSKFYFSNFVKKAVIAINLP